MLQKKYEHDTKAQLAKDKKMARQCEKEWDGVRDEREHAPAAVLHTTGKMLYRVSGWLCSLNLASPR